MLILVTFGWGISYYLVDISLTDMDPFTLNAHRFLGAFFLALLLSGRKLKKVNKTTLKYSLITGSMLMLVYFSMTFGVKYTTLTNSGFLCSLTVVFTPLLGWMIWKQKLDKKLKWTIFLCFIGIALLTLNDDFSFNIQNLAGDLLSILCALSYALDLHLTEKAVSKKEVDPYLLGVFQLGVTGILNFIMAVMLETPHFPTEGNVMGSCYFFICILYRTGVHRPRSARLLYHGVPCGGDLYTGTGFFWICGLFSGRRGVNNKGLSGRGAYDCQHLAYGI